MIQKTDEGFAFLESFDWKMFCDEFYFGYEMDEMKRPIGKISHRMTV